MKAGSSGLFSLQPFFFFLGKDGGDVDVQKRHDLMLKIPNYIA